MSSMMDNANEARKQCKTQKVDSAVEIYTEKIRKNLENTREIVSGMELHIIIRNFGRICSRKFLCTPEK